MSLAYKLWKIGKVLEKEDLISSIQGKPESRNGYDPVYLNIDFSIDENNNISVTKF